VSGFSKDRDVSSVSNFNIPILYRLELHLTAYFDFQIKIYFYRICVIISDFIFSRVKILVLKCVLGTVCRQQGGIRLLCRTIKVGHSA